MTRTEGRSVGKAVREAQCGTGDIVAEALARLERSIERYEIRFRRNVILIVFLIVGLNKALDFLIG